jgi:hypothetical protein
VREPGFGLMKGAWVLRFRKGLAVEAGDEGMKIGLMKGAWG